MLGNAAIRIDADARREQRDEVFHRARATTGTGTPVLLMVVNLSPGGMMARSERTFAVGDRLQVQLPVIGLVQAEVRWALGGRIGCQFERAVPAGSYYPLLAAMRG